jgi:hypothetical protein
VAKILPLSMLAGALLAGVTAPVCAQELSETVTVAPQASTMTLRDAIYFYNRPINSKATTILSSKDCDVFEIVLDVESGYTDLYMDERASESTPSGFAYPDRIESHAAMFAYTLYSSNAYKSFTLRNNKHTGFENSIGAATFFGYCFSTKESASVWLYDESAGTCHYSNSIITQNCPKLRPSTALAD